MPDNEDNQGFRLLFVACLNFIIFEIVVWRKLLIEKEMKEISMLQKCKVSDIILLQNAYDQVLSLKNRIYLKTESE